MVSALRRWKVARPAVRQVVMEGTVLRGHLIL
jgi:hypothetical protein